MALTSSSCLLVIVILVVTKQGASKTCIGSEKLTIQKTDEKFGMALCSFKTIQVDETVAGRKEVFEHLVTLVEPESVADQLGIRSGHLLLVLGLKWKNATVNNTNILTDMKLEQVQEAFSKLNLGEKFLMVTRKNTIVSYTEASILLSRTETFSDVKLDTEATTLSSRSFLRGKRNLRKVVVIHFSGAHELPAILCPYSKVSTKIKRHGISQYVTEQTSTLVLGSINTTTGNGVFEKQTCLHFPHGLLIDFYKCPSQKYIFLEIGQTASCQTGPFHVSGLLWSVPQNYRFKAVAFYTPSCIGNTVFLSPSSTPGALITGICNDFIVYP